MYNPDSMIVTIANNIVRKMLNDAFSDPRVNEDNLVIAIRNNLSLWGESGDVILDYKDKIPPVFMSVASNYVNVVNDRLGGFTNLTLMWLREDKPTFHSLIINTPGGKEWLEVQVNDIIKGIGLVKGD